MRGAVEGYQSLHMASATCALLPRGSLLNRASRLDAPFCHLENLTSETVTVLTYEPYCNRFDR